MRSTCLYRLTSNLLFRVIPVFLSAIRYNEALYGLSSLTSDVLSLNDFMILLRMMPLIASICDLVADLRIVFTSRSFNFSR